ncbi:hypothetical protein [Blastomonas aquatica]|uniref:hypothetical protein n=1 Tax=Blastomonas aquatica TaxID=1510276 RepID=UPI00166AEC6B|nr:hypothetical protein [Blastomonas aquatica]
MAVFLSYKGTQVVPIKLSKGPPSAQAIIAQTLSDLRLSDARTETSTPPVDQAALYPVPICVLAVDQLDNANVLSTAPQSGWRYVALEDGAPVLVDIVSTEADPAFSRILTGSPAEDFLVALTAGESAAGDQPAQAAVIFVPAIYGEALWVGWADTNFLWDLASPHSSPMTADGYFRQIREDRIELIVHGDEEE